MKAIIKKIFNFVFKEEIEKIQEHVELLEDTISDYDETFGMLIEQQEEMAKQLNKVIDFLNETFGPEQHEHADEDGSEDLKSAKPKSNLLN